MSPDGRLPQGVIQELGEKGTLRGGYSGSLSLCQPPPVFAAEENVVPEQRREVWQAVCGDRRVLVGQPLRHILQVDVFHSVMAAITRLSSAREFRCVFQWLIRGDVRRVNSFSSGLYGVGLR